jgi:hypothetical protein
MALFCFIQIVIFILGVSYSNLAANIRKILLFVRDQEYTIYAFPKSNLKVQMMIY